MNPNDFVPLKKTFPDPNASSKAFPPHWLNRPYNSLDAYLKNTYGFKVYKIALDAGFTCPNRDGTLDNRGCIFCSQGGSGDFAVKAASIEMQIRQGLELFGEKKIGNKFIAYFQAYTNTYGPPEYLKKIYEKALSHPDVVAISIATRPDCLPSPVLHLLRQLQKDFPSKSIWVELGLQTIHENTAEYIRRGYPLQTFASAMNSLKEIGIPAIIHLILGLPKEGRQQILETIDYLNGFTPFGIKLQLLHILKGTDLAKDYEAGKFQTLSQNEYLSLVGDCLAHLSPDIVIHRLTGDGPKSLTIAPHWSLNKRNVLNSLHKYLKKEKIYQGCLFRKDTK